MLLFKHELVPLIRSGVKTQTRRTGPKRWKVGAVHQARTNMSKASTFAWLTVTDVRRERVRAISVADARAEGYPTRAAFLKAWRAIAGTDAGECWVIEFVADESRPEGRPVDAS